MQRRNKIKTINYPSNINLIPCSIIISATILCFLIQCKTEECFKGSGPDGIIQVETGYFREVNINGIFDVILVQDTVSYVEFEGGKDMLQYVKAENTDSILWIDNSNSCLFLKDYKKIKSFVHFSDLNVINFFEPCKIRSQNPLTDDFSLLVPADIADLDIELNNNNFFFYNHQTSGGNYVFRGKCTNCYLMGFYTARIDASQLTTSVMTIENHSAVDYYVRAEETLHVQIYNRGNVYYYDAPEVVIDTIDGTGKVFKVN
jgi:hypothetical protein